MAQLAIRGHATRGKEVIEILEMLGGKNINSFCGEIKLLYYFIENDEIWRCKVAPTDSIIFTLEEFLEKYPYKVGDLVLIPEYESPLKITDMVWTGINIIYEVFTDEGEWFIVEELQPYKEQEKTLQEIINESIDKTNKVIFDTNVQCCDIRNEIVNKEQENYCQVVGNDTSSEGINTSASSITENDMEEDNIKNLCRKCLYAVNNNHCGLKGFRNDFNVNYCSAYNDEKLPNGFLLQQDGYYSWINNTQYPKTYSECCAIMGVAHDTVWFDSDDVPITKEGLDYEKHLEDILCAFRKLLICRDAYWKIAGDWKEKRKGKAIHYVIYSTLSGKVVRDEMPNCIANYLFDFPTAEMRDAFKESKEISELIEKCKEFL